MSEQSVDVQYADLISRILATGQEVVTRNARVKRLFAEKAVFVSTPLVAARRTAWKNALREWEWFMSGSCDIADLHPSVRPWWAPWVRDDGLVLNNYSTQFRYSCGRGNDQDNPFDQLRYLIDGIRNHPCSRRNVVTTWNTSEMADKRTPLTNCHGTVIQAFVNPDNSLHLVTYQRSADVVCGLLHNWIQYWAFFLWLTHRTERTMGTFTWIGGDVHVYEQHWELARDIVAAVSQCSSTPQLVYTPSSDDFRADDFTLDVDYCPVVLTRAEMVV